MSRLDRIKSYLPRPWRRRLADLRASFAYRDLPKGDGCIVPPSTRIIAPTRLGRKVVLGPNILLNRSTVGDYSYLGGGCRFVQTEIGKYCSIAPDVHIGLGIHPLSAYVSTHPAFYLRREAYGWDLADRDYREEFGSTKVGNDVWIGFRAIIRDNVTVGDGAVIGAGAVVVDDVPPYAIVGGVPAKLIRYRFSDDIIRFLLAFKWWDRGEDWLRANWRKLHDVEKFAQEFSI